MSDTATGTAVEADAEVVVGAHFNYPNLYSVTPPCRRWHVMAWPATRSIEQRALNVSRLSLFG